MAEPVTPTSFIPHDTAVPGGYRPRCGGLNDLLLLCAIVLFVASAALAVAVFLYQQYLQTESASKLNQLQIAKKAFEPALINQFTRLDDRMHFADQLLATHIAPSVFFHALEEATLKTVAFQTLSFDAAESQHMTIKMAGVAKSVNSIALQADLLSKNGVITSPIFSGIARQIDGVHFDLTALVNPASIKYSNQFQDSGTAAVVPTQPQTPASPFDAPSTASGASATSTP